MNLRKAQMVLDEDAEYGVWHRPSGIFLGWYGKAVVLSMARAFHRGHGGNFPLGIFDICPLMEAKKEGRIPEGVWIGDLAYPLGMEELKERLERLVQEVSRER